MRLRQDVLKVDLSCRQVERSLSPFLTPRDRHVGQVPEASAQAQQVSQRRYRRRLRSGSSPPPKHAPNPPARPNMQRKCRKSRGVYLTIVIAAENGVHDEHIRAAGHTVARIYGSRPILGCEYLRGAERRRHQLGSMLPNVGLRISIYLIVRLGPSLPCRVSG